MAVSYYVASAFACRWSAPSATPHQVNFDLSLCSDDDQTITLTSDKMAPSATGGKKQKKKWSKGKGT